VPRVLAPGCFRHGWNRGEHQPRLPRVPRDVPSSPALRALPPALTALLSSTRVRESAAGLIPGQSWEKDVPRQSRG